MTILRVLSFQAVCAVAFLVLFAVPASASERFALIIGNGSYGDGPLSPLRNPVNDAVLIGKTLERTGFQVDLVMDADLRGMKRAVSAFTQRLSSAGPDAIALFYFSGHGFQANNLNYLAPLGADLKDEVDAEFEAMSVDWVLAKLEAAHRGANVIILDACRNTALSRSFRTVGEGLAMMARTPAGSFISYATAPGSVAADGQGLNSPYSAAIAREIARPGLSLERAFKNVRRSVVAETAGAQVPWDYSSLTADIVLVRAGDPAATPQAQADASAGTLIELQLWNDVKDSGSAEALQAYLDRYPDGAFAALAKTRIRGLGTGGGDTAAQIQALFANLTSRGLIIENPTRPHEFYANARMHEIQGDYPAARQDYLKFFAFQEPKVDPHLRFQAFLRVQEGRAGAEAFYDTLTRGQTDTVSRFAAALLAPTDRRLATLAGITAVSPDFAPAFYELSQEYSVARLGAQSAADRKQEGDLLRRFLDLVEQGQFLTYFYDQQLAANQVEDARTRLAALGTTTTAALENPVRLEPALANDDWIVNVGIGDTVTEIFVSHSGRD
ncbi:MAG: caspase family protein, partial [Pseudomonadota bacterium]